jgi:hypothetical protein
MLRILTPVGCVLAGAALLAGCGGSGNGRNAGSATASSSGRAHAGLKMAQCMRANGVPSFPDPSSNGGPIGIAGGGSNGTVTVGGVSVAQSTLRAAFQKCQKDLPQGPPLTSAQIASLRQGALKMAQCMRAHGVPNFPDPQITTGPGGHGIGIRIGPGPGAGGQTAGNAKRPPPAFQSAQKVCMPLMQKAFGKRPGQ